MDMPNWPELWEREPRLKSEHLRHEAWGYESGNQAGEFDPCHIEVAAALCRDAAADFAARHFFVVSFYPSGESEKPWRLDSWPESEHEPAYIDEFPTRDAALFAACKAILDARP